MPLNPLRCPRCGQTSTVRAGTHCHCATPTVEKIDLRVQTLLLRILPRRRLRIHRPK